MSDKQSKRVIPQETVNFFNDAASAPEHAHHLQEFKILLTQSKMYLERKVSDNCGIRHITESNVGADAESYDITTLYEIKNACYSGLTKINGTAAFHDFNPTKKIAQFRKNNYRLLLGFHVNGVNEVNISIPAMIDRKESNWVKALREKCKKSVIGGEGTLPLTGKMPTPQLCFGDWKEDFSDINLDYSSGILTKEAYAPGLYKLLKFVCEITDEEWELCGEDGEFQVMELTDRYQILNKSVNRLRNSKKVKKS